MIFAWLLVLITLLLICRELLMKWWIGLMVSNYGNFAKRNMSPYGSGEGSTVIWSSSQNTSGTSRNLSTQ
uniref:Uncharacterized protein n=1 Tax=Setaria italica TaxID=4555 RepID=K3ZGE2_SETIT